MMELPKYFYFRVKPNRHGTEIEIEDASDADVVEVVRCKNCKWWYKSGESNYGYCHAAKHEYYSRNWEISIYRTYKEDFFCGDGDRKEEDDERGGEENDSM